MAKTIQVRDIDDDTHRVLTARAEAAGLSLSQYLRSELDQLAGRLSVREAFALFADRLPGKPLPESVVLDAIHSGREGR